MERPEFTKPSHIPIPFNHIRRASADNLKRAARHYRRTLTTLQISSFEHLTASTMQKLVEHLTDGLDVVEEELRRRGVGSPVRESRPPTSPSNGNNHTVKEDMMPVTVQAQGEYELVETTQAHRILVFENRWFAWIDGHRGQVLVPTDGCHQKAHALWRGRYLLLVGMDDGPADRSAPRLMLERDGYFEEYIVSRGLPAKDDAPHPIVPTGRSITRDGLARYVGASVGTRRAEERGPRWNEGRSTSKMPSRKVELPSD